jgi:hypothetical protein
MVSLTLSFQPLRRGVEKRFVETALAQDLAKREAATKATRKLGSPYPGEILIPDPLCDTGFEQLEQMLAAPDAVVAQGRSGYIHCYSNPASDDSPLLPR